MLAYGALGQAPEDCLPPASHKGIRDLNLRSQGARRLSGGQWEFVLWAPFQREVTLHVLEPQESRVPMQSETCGYYSAIVEHLEPGSTYSYELHEGRNLPNPASRSQ